MFERPEHWASVVPGRPAVVSGAEVLTYGEWNDRADRLADALSTPGLAEGAVGVRTHMRPEWFVINLALAKLARPFVPVSWRLTPAEAGRVVRDGDVGVVFFDDAEPDAPAVPIPLAGDGPRTYHGLLRAGRPVPRRSDRPPPTVTYTSGTTGAPKGVRKGRPRGREQMRRYKEYVHDVRAGNPFGEGNRTLLTLPLHHGAGPGQAARCFGTGGTLYLLDRYDPVRVLELIQEHRITHWTTVPTMLHRIRILPEEVLGRYDVSSLAMLGVGAAPVPHSLKEWAISYFGEGRLYENYGSTETGLVTCMPPAGHRVRPGSCGRPYRHVDVHIADGEICVRSPMTAGGFVRTGDLGRLDADGFLYVTGRSKDLIISGGVNIGPTEIEHVLVEHPRVVDAVVIGVPDEDMGEVVVAYCEPVPGRAVSEAELAAFLTGRIADYKIPKRIEFLDEFPRNAMGKVVRAALRTERSSDDSHIRR